MKSGLIAYKISIPLGGGVFTKFFDLPIIQYCIVNKLNSSLWLSFAPLYDVTAITTRYDLLVGQDTCVITYPDLTNSITFRYGGIGDITGSSFIIAYPKQENFKIMTPNKFVIV